MWITSPLVATGAFLPGYRPLRQPLLHLFEEPLVELVDRVVAGRDQVLHGLWEGLVFPRGTVEGLRGETTAITKACRGGKT